MAGSELKIVENTIQLTSARKISFMCYFMSNTDYAYFYPHFAYFSLTFILTNFEKRTHFSLISLKNADDSLLLRSVVVFGSLHITYIMYMFVGHRFSKSITVFGCLESFKSPNVKSCQDINFLLIDVFCVISKIKPMT